jgi:glyoxylase-like metal-dependent hydrolase (beta-lactamase superfamily II)
MNSEKAQIEGFFDADTFTISYVVSCPRTQHCVIIDPVLDYAPNSGRTSTASADNIVRYVREHRLQVDSILETHVHADHLSAADYLRSVFGAPIGIGDNVSEVQQVFCQMFNLGAGATCDSSVFDRLLGDQTQFRIGELPVTVLHTPGHTPACVSYLVGDAVFVGDTLFMPDYGTARCDFPGGDAHALYRSIRRLLALPGETRMFLCHDYLPAGRRQYRWETTVATQRAENIHIRDGVSESAFVQLRLERDATLDVPRLLLPSVQVNIRAGALPPAEANGNRYLKIPLNVL